MTPAPLDDFDDALEEALDDDRHPDDCRCHGCEQAEIDFYADRAMEWERDEKGI